MNDEMRRMGRRERLTEDSTVDLACESDPAILSEKPAHWAVVRIAICKQCSGLCNFTNVDGPVGRFQSPSFGVQATSSRQGVLQCPRAGAGSVGERLGAV